MRQYKFRVWHKKLKEMFTIAHLHFGIDGLRKAETGSLLSDTWILEDIELMQFTGLSDRRGKEIYEGDIVEITVDQWTGASDTFRGVITYDVKRWCYRLTGDHREFNLIYADEVEVIGNVWEHPDLIRTEEE